MKAKTSSLGLLALLALSTAAWAADGFTITRKVKKDDLQKFTLKADVDLGGAPANVSATFTEKVTDVATDGTYTVQHTQIEMKVNALGNETDVPPGDPLVTVFKPSGEIVKINGNGDAASPAAYRMANLEVLFDPGKPVSVGDSWSHEFPEDKATGAKKAKGDYKLLAEEKIGSFDTLKIQFTVKEAGADGAGSDGTVWIDKTDGSLVKATMKWTNAPIPPATMPLNATLTIDRV